MTHSALGGERSHQRPDIVAEHVEIGARRSARLRQRIRIEFAADLGAKERWLLINKIDLLEPAEAQRRSKEIVRRLRWKGPVLRISGATGAGTDELKQAVMRYLEEHPRVAEPHAEQAVSEPLHSP